MCGDSPLFKLSPRKDLPLVGKLAPLAYCELAAQRGGVEEHPTHGGTPSTFAATLWFWQSPDFSRQVTIRVGSGGFTLPDGLREGATPSHTAQKALRCFRILRNLAARNLQVSLEKTKFFCLDSATSAVLAKLRADIDPGITILARDLELTVTQAVVACFPPLGPVKERPHPGTTASGNLEFLVVRQE